MEYHYGREREAVPGEVWRGEISVERWR